MRILNLPWFDRPSERLIRKGPSSLSDSELLAVLLWRVPKRNVLNFSRYLLKKYNFNGLSDLGYKKILRYCENDKVSALRIMSFIELSKRYSKFVKGGFNTSSKPINSAKDVYDKFVDDLGKYDKEVLKVALLDSKNIVISEKEVSVGILNSSLVHPREVFRMAIRENANSLILVHNHPSGSVEPSEGDAHVTERLREAGKILKIEVKDHVIIGKKGYYSFREEGKLT